MHQEKRLKKIMQMLAEQGDLSTQQLIDSFNISRDTARRDILQLVENGKVVRRHGGIMLLEEKQQVLNYFERLSQLSAEKIHMAEQAEKQIVENSLCFIDVSTILFQLAQKIKTPCQVYTHSLDNAFALGQQTKIKLNVLGGTFDFDNRFFYGEDVLKQLDQVKFDLALIGAASLERDGFYFKEDYNARIKSKIIERSRKVVLVAEQQKFDKKAHYKGGNYEDLDVLITDQQLKPSQVSLFEKSTKIIY